MPLPRVCITNSQDGCCYACSGLLQFIMVMGHGHGVRETPGQRAESVKFVDGVVIHSDDPQ